MKELVKEMKFVIESKLDDVFPLIKKVREILEITIKDEILLYNMILCLNEAITNSIQHAYQYRPGNYIDVTISVEDHDVTFYVIDEGNNTYFLNKKKLLDFDPKDIANIPESGMGLFIIESIMDEIKLSNTDGKNIFFMRKHLN